MYQDKPLLHAFQGKKVRVKIHGLLVEGRLIHYEDGNDGKPHRPQTLILETEESRKIILRGAWESIGV